MAEGIERQDQLDAIRGLGCGLGQGYLLAAPMPAAAFEALFAGEHAAAPDGVAGRLGFGSSFGAEGPGRALGRPRSRAGSPRVT